MNKQNDSIGEQMKNIKSNVSFPRSKMFPLPSLNVIGKDGSNHINIWESGETNLGRALSSFTAMPFKHSLYGKFTSIEGFWHYIRSTSKDDNLRHLSGYNARSFGRSLENDNVPDMYYTIADANWQKIKTYPALVQEIKNLHIPFDLYYLEVKKSKTNDMPIRARSLHSTWLIPAFHEIHEAVHQEREPDFTFLKDENKAQFYHPLIKKERSEGGYNAHLLDVYKERPIHPKPKHKQVAVLTEGKGNFGKKEKYVQQDALASNHQDKPESDLEQRLEETQLVEDAQRDDQAELELSSDIQTGLPEEQITGDFIDVPAGYNEKPVDQVSMSKVLSESDTLLLSPSGTEHFSGRT